MVPRVSLVCSDHRAVGSASLRSSVHTGKPMPPAITASPMARHSHQSPTKATRLLLNSEKPALLNADTAWKTPW